jgi:hypothetical protein
MIFGFSASLGSSETGAISGAKIEPMVRTVDEEEAVEVSAERKPRETGHLGKRVEEGKASGGATRFTIRKSYNFKAE